MIADVIIFNGPAQLLSYSVGPEMQADLREGQRVIVPLGRRKAFGLVYGLSDREDNRLKPVAEIIDRLPLLDKNHLQLLHWLCRYYFASPRDAVGLFLPKDLTDPDSLAILAIPKDIDSVNLGTFDPLAINILKYVISRKSAKLSTVKTKFKTPGFYGLIGDLESAGLIRIGFRQTRKRVAEMIESDEPAIDAQELMFNSEQAQAYAEVLPTLQKGIFQAYLLFGVTGSGKSELYLKLIWEAISLGRTALFLLPEIVSTEELYRRIRLKLGDIVCRIHSGLTSKERSIIWQEIRSGEFKVVIGPRSALFVPLPNLGLIIVDEEHDSSYKQTGVQPQYHGRDLALILARLSSCPVILGSATPSVESWHNAQTGKYKLLRLRSRWDNRQLPRIMPVEYAFSPRRGALSEPLLAKMTETLRAKGQIMLLLNRRGFAPTVKCGECGFTFACPNCSVGLVYHRTSNTLKCHFCEYSSKSSDICPRCSGNSFLYFGVGTQKLEEEIKTAFPKVPFARLDLDTASKRENLVSILSGFRQGKTRILIGTQMIAKAFDFPQVALMGILSADSYLEFPDFRSREKTFALLLQASGRAGRGKFPGEVIIQHTAFYKEFVENLSEDQVESFLNEELKSRAELGFPPNCHLILIHLKSPQHAEGEKAVNALGRFFQQNHHKCSGVFEIMGPIESPLFKLRNNYRWQFIIKTSAVFGSLEILESLLGNPGLKKTLASIRLSVDVDPVDML